MRDFARYEPELPLQPELPLAQDTLAQKFAAYDLEHPEIWEAFEDCIFEHIRNGETYISPRDLAPEIRHKVRHGVNNSFFRFYGDKFRAKYPHYAYLFRERRRPERKMKLVYTR